MASYASALLFYGTFVNALDLSMAGDAWSRCKPVFLALDLVVLRRSNGTLRVSGDAQPRATVLDLPVEIWVDIKVQLVCVETSKSKEHADDFARYPQYYSGPPLQCMFPFGHCDCDGSCFDMFFNEYGGMSEMNDNFSERRETLLCDFGLNTYPFSMHSDEGDSWGDVNSLFPLALPLRTDKAGPFGEIGVDSEEEYRTTSSFLTINPAVFALPANTASRFRNFLTLFGLDTYDISEGEIVPDESRGTRPPKSPTAASEPHAASKLKPHGGEPALAWHLGGTVVAYI